MNEPAPAASHEVMSPGPARSLVAGAVGLVVFASLAAALVASASQVPGPSGWTLAELQVWFEHQPVGAAFRGLAAIGVIVVGYLAVGTVAVMLAGIAAAARLPRLSRVAEIVAVPVVRRTIAAALGLGLTVTNAASAHATPTPARSTVATMHALDPTSATDAPLTVVEPEPTWTISAGDHLWGLAASALRERWARSPTDVEVAEYLDLVIERNRTSLAVPDQPDLVFPGQVFARPPVPPG